MSTFDIKKKKAFVCDLDGTLFMGPNPIKPAVDFVIENTKSGRFCFFYLTNNTSKTPAEYMKKIAGANIPVEPDQILTPLITLEEYIREKGYKSVYLVASAAVVKHMDERLSDIGVSFGFDPERNELGFDKVGVFYVDVDLMKDDRGYNAQLYDSAVFVVQETTSIENFLSLQDRSAQRGPQFNLSDDLDYIDEEMVVVRSIACQPRLAVPYSNSERLLQLRTYNSPNYERNFAKAQMFESAEHDLFRRCGMLTVFMGTAVFGSWVPNVTYMLSFENNEARREGWSKFGQSPEWGKLSKDPQYARTATRIRNLFLRPSQESQI